MNVTNFGDLTRAGVERFLQTVLVIDNELKLDDSKEPPPSPLITPPSTLRASTPPPVALTPPAEPAPPAEPRPSSGSPLDAKQIMDAFLRRSMICGMHKPTRGDELVSEAIRAARRSDAVIIDWMLDGSDPSAAKNIIAGILAGDVEENGRLRLIAVYTSQQDVAGVVKQIRDHLNDLIFEEAGLGVLRKPNTRIVVLNKEDTVGASQSVKVIDLPERVVEEFAKLSTGVLSTFAISAIAAVRRETHHVLAIFSEELDGAFLGHMCALSSTDDAKEFALDLLGGELRNVASMNAATSDVLSPANLALHIDGFAREGMISMSDIKVPIEKARAFPSGGKGFVVASHQSQQRHRNGLTDNPPRKEAVNPGNVGYLFYSDNEIAEAAHRRFARFASFRTEPYNRTLLPDAWVPTLMLGSLIVRSTQDGIVDSSSFLLCTQPRCDAVRLKERRYFPFQTVSVVSNGGIFDLVAAVPTAKGNAETVLLLIGAKPHEARMVEFGPTTSGRVQAGKLQDGRFMFKDTEGQFYVWIGDLREMTAQRAASAVAARLHQVGLDEYEWLRIKAGKTTD